LSVELIKEIILFIAISYLFAFFLDAMLLYGLLPAFLWGFVRIWSVMLSAILCLKMFGGKFSGIRDFIRFSRNLLKIYLFSPLIIYVVLGIYIAIATLLGFFDFSSYVNLIFRGLAETMNAPEEEIARLSWALSYIQIALAYVPSITLNAIFALGEEIGWRATCTVCSARNRRGKQA